MNVLLVNGSPHKNGCTYTALHEAATQLEALGIDTEIFHIGNRPIAGCIACGQCSKTGLCVFGDDGVNACIEAIQAADGVILGAPVYYAGAAGSMNAFMDRVFYAAGRTFAQKPGAAVVSCRRGGASATFDRLNKYFTISQMPVAASQYWNSVHGNTPDEVRQDLEGLQVMRTLAKNMNWLLRCIEAGKAAGVPLPEPEPRVSTNFIR